MLEEVRQLAAVAAEEIEAAQDDKALEALRVHHLGRKSRLRLIARQIGQQPATERPALGEATGPRPTGHSASSRRQGPSP